MINVASDQKTNASLLPLQLKKILVPIDFSPLSKKALHYAVEFAQQFNARLTVLKVLDPPPGIVNLQEAAFSDEKLLLTEKNLRALIDGSRSNGVSEAGFTVRVGIPSHEIVEAARELDVDLIVIGTHGYTGWKHFCIGSTAERVVRAAPCPVFVVREKEHEFF
jgi:nucleotide-binding universal stress UspA family protein